MRKIFVRNEVSDTDKIHRSNGFQFLVRGSPYVGAHARMNFRAANGAFAIAMRQSRRGCDTLHASASHSFESKRVGSFVPSRDKRPRFFNFRSVNRRSSPTGRPGWRSSSWILLYESSFFFLLSFFTFLRSVFKLFFDSWFELFIFESEFFLIFKIFRKFVETNIKRESFKWHEKFVFFLFFFYIIIVSFICASW